MGRQERSSPRNRPGTVAPIHPGHGHSFAGGNLHPPNNEVDRQWNTNEQEYGAYIYKEHLNAPPFLKSRYISIMTATSIRDKR